jgi:hypothetical protein
MYERTTEDDVPPSRACDWNPSPFEQTSEWKRLEKDLAAGIAKGEALRLSWTARELKQIGVVRRSIARFLQRHLERNGMTHYRVESFSREGREWVRVVHPSVSARQRRTA